MNKTLVQRVENDEVETKYYKITLRLLQGELWTVETGRYSNSGDHELADYRQRTQRAIEKVDRWILELNASA